MMRLTLLALVLCALWLPACKSNSLSRGLRPTHVAMLERHEADVAKVLDNLHDAASKADGRRYFSLFSPGAVFLGTDANERWSLAEFKEYVAPFFARGKGWTYIPKQRNVWVSTDGWAVFDELLTNEKYGTCRGSGSMRLIDQQGWKIEQYDLSVPIPNALIEDFARQIREHESKPKSDTPSQAAGE